MTPRAALVSCLLLLALPLAACGAPTAEAEAVFETHELGRSGAPRLRVGFYALTSAEELSAAVQGDGIELAADFTETRLAVLAPEFTSGSMGLEFVGVLEEKSEYVIQYRIDTPEIGTMDMAYPIILVELPKDGNSVRFEQIEP